MTLSTALQALRTRSDRLGRATRGGCALLLAVGCTAAPTEQAGPPSDARLTGFLGGERFVARAEAFVKRTSGAPDSLYLVAGRDVPARGTTESLVIRVELAGVGSYPLAMSQVRLIELVGGDGIIRIREGSGTASGVLTLTSIGTIGDLVGGTVRFRLASSQGSPPAPEEVEFTDGVFNVRLIDPLGSAASVH